MADSIKLTFIHDDSADTPICTEPSYNEVYSFFQDIIHVATPEETALGAGYFQVIPAYRSSFNAGPSEPVEVTYRVVDFSQINNGGEITITGTNYWDLFVNGPNGTPPSDFIVYDISLAHGRVSLESFQFNPSLYDPTANIEITFFKDGNSKTVPEPEVYPSVARSLDKLVDKMEGNTVKVPGDEKTFETGFSYTTTHQTIDSEDGPSIFVNLTGTLDDLPEWTEQKCTVQLLHSGEIVESVPMTLFTEYVPIDSDNADSDNVEYAVTEYYTGTNSFPQTDYFKIVLSVLDGEGNPPDHNLSLQYYKRVIMAKGSSLAFFKDLPPSDKGYYHPADYTIRFVGAAESKTVPAYETYKEAVPSVERSMWKIAELYESNKDSITLGNTTLTESDLVKLLSIINDEDEGASSGGYVPPSMQ